MNEQNGNTEKKEKKDGQNTTFSPLAIVALLLFTLTESGDTGMVMILITALMVGALVYVVYKGVSKYVKKRKGEAPEEVPAQPGAAEIREDVEAPAPAQAEPAEGADRERRLRQLDDWLEGGLISKEEYRERKERLEKEP